MVIELLRVFCRKCGYYIGLIPANWYNTHPTDEYFCRCCRETVETFTEPCEGLPDE